MYKIELPDCILEGAIAKPFLPVVFSSNIFAFGRIGALPSK